MATIEELRQYMINAEDNGMSGRHSVQSAGCVLYYWLVGYHIITYITDDEEFVASMLTEDMMDELFIEEVQ